MAEQPTMLDHERLDVYHHALALLDLVDRIKEDMGGGHLTSQLDRASTSIVLNIAEGAGEFSFDEKNRFYRMARRSATETAAVLDILERRKTVALDKLAAARERVVSVVAMLVKLIGRDGGRGTGTGTGTGRNVF